MTRRKPLAGIYQLTTFLALVLLLLILFISAAYFFFIPAPDKSSDDSDRLAVLAQKQATWEAERPASFRYVVDRDCDCADDVNRPYTVTDIGGDRQAEYSITVEAATGEQLMADLRGGA